MNVKTGTAVSTVRVSLRFLVLGMITDRTIILLAFSMGVKLGRSQ
jgi:hypothetical protein